ncbi:MAG TPA: nucleotide-binding protein [Gemmatimonadaceae bacterium]|nr:nucleotide-binding protein [Gemmatimonadaceae bacterium]
MYSLFVSYTASERDSGTFTLERSRFLEYTADGISAQLRTLANEAKASIASWPCLLMQEGRGQEVAHIVGITQIDHSPREIKITANAVMTTPTIVNDALWRMREALDLGDFEFSRNHLAIKDRDLLSILSSAGYAIDASAVTTFSHMGLPAPARPDLLRARDKIASWGHTEIDDLVMEAGVDGLLASRALGSRHDRANAIVRFALDNPSATTAENSLFSAFVVKRGLGVPTSGDEQETEPAAPVPSSQLVAARTLSDAGRFPNRVFVVHGQNDAARSSVVSFLESLDLVGIVLHEQPNMGRHLLTKFIDEAAFVSFAVVLMTADDVGARRGENLLPRARQNVILELGYFLARLGQPRTCALVTPGLEAPSDFDGIVYIEMSSDEKWKVELRRELVAAGLPVG